MNDLNVSVIMRLVNKMRGPAMEAQGDLRRIERQTERLERRTGGAARAQVLMGKAGRMAMRGVAFGAGAAALAAGNSVRQAASMQDRWSDANKTLELTPLALEDMKDAVDEMATRIPVAREGLVDIVAAAGQIGIRGRADILAFTEDAAKMSETFDVTAAQAGTMMGEWREQMKYSQDEVRLLADKINFLGNTTGANSAQLAAYTSNIIGIADAAGMGEDATLAFGAAIIASGRAPEVAATGMRGLFRTMTKGIDDMTKAESKVLNRIGLVTQWDGIKDQMQTDASGAVMRVVEAINTLPKADRAAATTRLFGEEAHRALGTLLSDADQLKAALDRIPGISQAAGSMNAEYMALSQDAADNWERVKNAMASRSERFGATLLGPINEGLVGLLGTLRSLDDRASVFDRIGASWKGFANGFTGGEGSEIAETLGRISGAIGDFILGAKGEDAGEVLAKVFRNAQALGERAAAVRAAMGDTLGEITTRLAPLRGELDAILAGDFEGVERTLSGFLDWVRTAEIPYLDLSGILPAQIENMPVIEDALAMLQALSNSYVDLVNLSLNLGVDFHQGFLSTFTDSLGPYIENLSSAYDQLQPVIDNITRIFTALGSAFRAADGSEGLSNEMTELGAAVGALSGLALQTAALALEALARAIVAITGAIASLLEGDFAGAIREIDDFLSWAADLVLPDFLKDFTLADFFADAFGFEWTDVLPDWKWDMIIPDLPDLKALFGRDASGAAADVDVDVARTKVSRQRGFDRLSGEQQQAAATLEVLRRNGDLPTAKMLDGLEAQAQQARTQVAELQAEIDQLPDTFRNMAKRKLFEWHLDGAKDDLSAAQTALENGRKRADEMFTALKVLNDSQVSIKLNSSTVDRALANIGRLNKQLDQTGTRMANLNRAPADKPVQARAVGGNFGPGWLLTGERGPELEYRTKGGFIAHHGQLQEMARRSETIRRNVRSTQSRVAAPDARRLGVIAQSQAIRRSAHHGQLQEMARRSETIRRNVRSTQSRVAAPDARRLGVIAQSQAIRRSAHHGQLIELARRGETIRRNVRGAQSLAAAPDVRLQGAISRSQAIRRAVTKQPAVGTVARQSPAGAVTSIQVGDIHIHPAPGTDPAAIAREVRREIQKMADAKRGDLHDGEMYG